MSKLNRKRYNENPVLVSSIEKVMRLNRKDAKILCGLVEPKPCKCGQHPSFCVCGFT